MTSSNRNLSTISSIHLKNTEQNKKSCKSKKRNWFRWGKRTTTTEDVEEQSFYSDVLSDLEVRLGNSNICENASNTGKSFVIEIHDDEVNILQLEKARQILRIEENLNRNLTTVESSPLRKAFASKPSKKLPYVESIYGIKCFEGLENDSDNESLNAVIEEEKARRRARSQNSQSPSGPIFIEAPKDYDPIASGFYKPSGTQIFSSTKEEL